MRARKNNVLHVASSQLLDALLTQNPAHGIRDITLAAAVGSHNTGDPVVKIKMRFIGKGLKPLQFYTF